MSIRQDSSDKAIEDYIKKVFRLAYEEYSSIELTEAELKSIIFNSMSFS